MPAIEAGQFNLEFVHGDELAEKLIRRDSEAIMEANVNLLKNASARSEDETKPTIVKMP